MTLVEDLINDITAIELAGKIRIIIVTHWNPLKGTFDTKDCITD